MLGVPNSTAWTEMCTIQVGSPANTFMEWMWVTILDTFTEHRCVQGENRCVAGYDPDAMPSMLRNGTYCTSSEVRYVAARSVASVAR